jgi:hypothetical protein
VKRHTTYLRMLACPDSLSPEEQLSLSRHLQKCPDCRDLFAAFIEQGELVRGEVLREMPPSDVRSVVLDAASQSGVRVRRSFVSKRWSVRLGLAGLVIGAVSFTTPLPRVIAQVVGLPVATEPNPQGYVCTSGGVGIPNNYKILKSPSEFQTGLHGTVNPAALQQVAHDLVRPTWYVVGEGGVEGGGCDAQGRTIENVEVGFNPDNWTWLYATGIQKAGVQP